MKEANEIRTPISIPLSRRVLYSVLIFIGIVLGLFSKMIETTLNNSLPYFLEVLDLGNFSPHGDLDFHCSVDICISKSFIRSSVNVFLFLWVW